MSIDTGPGEATTLSPDEAFSVLGNEARLQILQTLGAADDSLAFSELYDRVEYEGSSNFGYHLEQLVGHFVSKTDDGYDLRQAGQRVVEAVLSGAVTDDPVLEPTTIDRPCPFCDADIRVAFQQERVELHCPECSGMGAGGYKDPKQDRFDDYGTLGHLLLPPAGVHGRTAPEVLQAAELWTATQVQSVSRGICPRCSAPIVHSTHVCENHSVTDDRCDQCDLRFAAMVSASCTNCIFNLTAPVVTHLAVHTELMSFMIDHGIDPVSPEGYKFPLSSVEETVLSANPFEARYTFTTDDDTLTLSVDDELSVVDVTRRISTGAE